MQIRTIVLVTTTVAVLGALLVLFFQVRSTPEHEVPAEALARARAQYERQSRRASEPFPANLGAATPPPRRMPTPDVATPEPVPSEGDPPGRTRAIRRSVSDVRPAMPEPTVAMPPGSSEAQTRVREAYDQNDFETALDLGQQFLNEFPGDPYVQRVVGVSACAVGQEDVARKYYALMNASDQAIVGRRCSRYGIALQR